MSHHEGSDGNISDAMKSLLGEHMKRQDVADHIAEVRDHLGATGEHPQGLLTEDDEGGIRIGFTAAGGKVVMAFGKEVEWIGFDAEQARAIAQTILDRAEECDGIKALVRRQQG